MPCPARQRTPSAKRTAPRTWSTQYCGVPNRSASIRPPVTFDTTGISGARKVRPASTSANPSSIASIRCEWKACDTDSRRTRCPAARKCSATATAASSSPETTTASGPLTAAIPTASARPAPAMYASASCSAASIATIAPPVGRACISRPRAATRAQASGSVSTPAAYAAVISPSEWPMT